MNTLVFYVAQNSRGQWVVRDPVTKHMALLDRHQGMVVRPGDDPTVALCTGFAWVLSLVSAADKCTDREGCSPFKA